MKLSERILGVAKDFVLLFEGRVKWTDRQDMIRVFGKLAAEVEQLETDIPTLENEVIRLEDKNDALMKLAGMYIKSYEDLAFRDATNEAWIYCDVCDDVIKPEELDDRHSVGLSDYHADCCPDCNAEDNSVTQHERS